MTAMKVRITTNSDIITSIPALLGFVPEQSVVTILLTGSKLLCAIRTDADAALSSAQITAVAQNHGADSALLVAVASTESRSQALHTLDTLRTDLADAGIDTRKALHAPAIGPGAPWLDLDTGEDGLCENPETSDTHLAYMMNGRSYAASRTALADRYTAFPGTPGITTRARAIARLTGKIEFSRETITALANVITARQLPDEDLAARVGVMIVDDVEARDAILALALNAPRDAHEAMAAVARQLTGTERAEALTVAGFFAYVGSDGAAAGLAFETVGQENEELPRLCELLDHALTSGMDPAMIRELAEVGVDLARGRGVDLTAN